jgi:dolichyl-phosphate-mannose-protein mannosyltransferase
MTGEGTRENRVEEACTQRLEVEESVPLRWNAPPYVWYGLLLLVIVFFGLIRFRLREMPLERDEGEYAYAGQLMLQGINPYRLVYTVKLPGSFAAYAAIMAVFGQTSAGIRIGLIFVNAATTLLVFLLGQRLYGRLAGLLAGATYALFSTSPFVLGFAGHATHFVVFFAVAGILVLLRALESDKPWLFFASGLLLGLAFLMKQPGLFFLLFASVYVIQQKCKPPLDWKSMIASLASLAFGGLLPFAATCLLILRDGLFGKFWFWTVDYARQYGTEQKLSDSLASLVGQTALETLVRVAAILLFVAVALGTFLWSGRARYHSFFTISFFLVSALAVCPGLYFRQHYFVLLLPAFSVLAGMIVSCVTEQLLLWRGSLMLAAAPLLLFLIAFSAPIVEQRKLLFQMSPLEACKAVYGPNPFPEAIEIANYIQNHSLPNATVAVLGSEPEIYFYSHRHSASGYIYVYPLLEPQRYALAMQSEMINEVETARPDVLVFVNVSPSWVHSFEPRSTRDIVNWMQRYVQQHYVMDGLADIGKLTQYYWGEEAKNSTPRSKNYIWIFKRNPS